MDTCREWMKTTKWKQLLTWWCQEKDQEGDQEEDGWIVSEKTCRNCGSPQMIYRTEHSGNQEFGPLTPPSGKRRRKRRRHIERKPVSYKEWIWDCIFEGIQLVSSKLPVGRGWPRAGVGVTTGSKYSSPTFATDISFFVRRMHPTGWWHHVTLALVPTQSKSANFVSERTGARGISPKMYWTHKTPHVFICY